MTSPAAKHPATPPRPGLCSVLAGGLSVFWGGKTEGRRLAPFLIGLLLTLLFAGAMHLRPPFLENIEAKLLDYRFRLRGALPPPETVVIAAIDEKSIGRLGRWPWDRDVMARLVERLDGAGAGVIVFDVIFSEAERHDPILGLAIGNAGNVLLPMVFDFDQPAKATDTGNKLLQRSAFATLLNPEKFAGHNPIAASHVLLPVTELIREAMQLGHINMFPDDDGTLRWEPLIIAHDGYLYPSLALQAAAMYLGVPHDRVTVQATEGIEVGRRHVPTDPWGRTLIPYYGPHHTFPHLSIADILDGTIKPEQLGNKIVLIGATAVGIYDLRVTPFSAAMPGVEKHASVIASILDERPLQAVSRPLNLAVLLLSGLLASLLLTRFKAVAVSSAVTFSGLGLLAVAGQYLFAARGLWLHLTYPALNLISLYTGITAYQYAVEEKNARQVRAMFSNYVTERVVNELIKHPEMAKLGGDRREITMLFSDIRGFTSFSEKHSPEEVVLILNEYLGEMTNIVFHWEGTLDKFIGDAILAFWGAPMAQDDQAERAMRCALHMVRRLEELQQKWRAEGRPLLDCGIGLNTGEVLVGNIGAEGKKMDYTVIGDHVNLASRVESLTKKYNAHILLTDHTLDKIREPLLKGGFGHLLIKGLERVMVKGKEHPVTIYQAIGMQEGESSRIVECESDTVVKLTEK